MVSRALEEAGIPTVVVATNRGPTGLVQPPRVLFTPFDRGQNFGPPGAHDTQRSILRAALNLLETATEPYTTLDWTAA